MDKILDYQVSLFGNFVDIKADDENINSMLKVFSNYVVNFIQMSSFDIRTSRVINDKRLQLINLSQGLLISFLPERIDINYKWNPTIKGETEIPEIYIKLSDNLKKLTAIFPDRLGNRVASSCNLLSKKYTDSELLSVIERYSNKNNIFDENDSISEWLLRFNSKKEEIFNGKKEFCNRLITLSLPQNPEFKNQILLSFDFNSDALIPDERFLFDDLFIFSDTIKDYFSQYTKKIFNE
ncbi:MAG: hypothetical protein J6V90_10120 [Treponema sp.]|nr:hypothetical protein [Treponema sp.]